MNVLTFDGIENIHAVMSLCESVRPIGPYWDRGLPLRQGLGGERVGDALDAIIVAACPEEGDVHPRRATRVENSLFTPAGVEFRFGQNRIVVDFHRDSQHLAGTMLATAFLANPLQEVCVDGEWMPVHKSLSLVSESYR